MAINAAPSSQLDSPSKDINAASTIARNMAAKSIGENTSVNEASPNTWLMITNNGASTSAICNGLLMITENAYSDRPFAASCIPTTFSIAFPAIATITRPANSSEMCIDFIDGSRAVTNQSETKAAAVLAIVNNATASQSGHRGFSSSSTSFATPVLPRFSEAGRYNKNKTSKTIATIKENVSSCGAAAECIQ